jgi:hypothetical protein
MTGVQESAGKGLERLGKRSSFIPITGCQTNAAPKLELKTP